MSINRNSSFSTGGILRRPKLRASSCVTNRISTGRFSRTISLDSRSAATACSCVSDRVSRSIEQYSSPMWNESVGMLNRRTNAAESRCCPERSEEHTSELQSHHDLVCRLLLEKKKKQHKKLCHRAQRRAHSGSATTCSHDSSRPRAPQRRRAAVIR